MLALRRGKKWPKLMVMMENWPGNGPRGYDIGTDTASLDKIYTAQIKALRAKAEKLRVVGPGAPP